LLRAHSNSETSCNLFDTLQEKRYFKTAIIRLLKLVTYNILKIKVTLTCKYSISLTWIFESTEKKHLSAIKLLLHVHV